MRRFMLWLFTRFTAFDPDLLDWARRQEHAANRATRRQERRANPIEGAVLGARRREEDRP